MSTGYQPLGNTVWYRSTPGGPEKSALGNRNVQIPGGSVSAPANPPVTPEFRVAYQQRYGVLLEDVSSWTRGPSNERKGAGIQALEYYCVHNPSFIGSPGISPGVDGDCTWQEMTDIGAFGGEYIVRQYIKDTTEPTPPPSNLLQHHKDGQDCIDYLISLEILESVPLNVREAARILREVVESPRPVLFGGGRKARLDVVLDFLARTERIYEGRL